MFRLSSFFQSSVSDFFDQKRIDLKKKKKKKKKEEAEKERKKKSNEIKTLNKLFSIQC